MKWTVPLFSIVLVFAASSASVSALPVSSTDLWQDATITGFSSQLSRFPMTRIFDGLEGGYRIETGNAIFAVSSAGAVHWVEWSTSTPITLRSLNLVAYHDFDLRDINYRGFNAFELSYDDGGLWVPAFNWLYDDPNLDQHYGGGPSHVFDPDPHDMTRSYLELTANLAAPVTSQFFRAEFTQQGNNGGPRVVELDGFAVRQSVPEPATAWLLGAGLVGLIGLGGKYAGK